MNRRDFLKVGSLVSAVGLIAASPLDTVFTADVEAAAFGKLYKATSKGRVLVSKDKGKSWQLHTRFGPDYAVLDIFIATDNRLFVKIGHKKARFYLVLTESQQAWAAEDFHTQPRPKA